MKTFKKILFVVFELIAVTSAIILLSTCKVERGYEYVILILIGIFAISTLAAIGLDNPNIYYRHIAAVSGVFTCFMYANFKICKQYGWYFNKYREKLGSYRMLYKWILAKFDYVTRKEPEHRFWKVDESEI